MAQHKKKTSNSKNNLPFLLINVQTFTDWTAFVDFTIQTQIRPCVVSASVFLPPFHRSCERRYGIWKINFPRTPAAPRNCMLILHRVETCYTDCLPPLRRCIKWKRTKKKEEEKNQSLAPNWPSLASWFLTGIGKLTVPKRAERCEGAPNSICMRCYAPCPVLQCYM